jgi:hypothetical protein
MEHQQAGTSDPARSIQSTNIESFASATARFYRLASRRFRAEDYGAKPAPVLTGVERTVAIVIDPIYEAAIIRRLSEECSPVAIRVPLPRHAGED